MPSPSKRKNLCIFGDSHIGCVKNALTQKIFKSRRALDFEFWGADGPRFRGLDLEGSTIVPRAEVLETVRLVNGKGRDILDPADFDAILFMGARIRTHEFFEPHLHRMQQVDGYLSDAVFRQNCEDWLPKNRFYRAAKAMAAVGHGRIFFAPTTFLTEGFEAQITKGCQDAVQASAGDRQKIWAELIRVAANDGIDLMPQSEETIANGCMTKRTYSNVLSNGEFDPVHRNPEYAAILLKDVVDRFYA